MRKWLPLIAVCLGTFMLLVDVTIVNVALPDMAKDLSTSFSSLQWVVDGYALSLAALLLGAGSIADIFGHRRFYIAGLALFAASSFACGIAPNSGALVAARLVQGVGAAAMLATTFALLNSSYQGRDRGTAYGMWGAVAGASAAVGPILGGLLTEGISWRWIFFVNLPLGVIAILVTLVGVQEFRPTHSRRVDVPGAAVFTFGLLALVYGLIESGRLGWGSTRVIVALALAVVALAAFPLIERARREPMFDLALLRKPTFVGGLIAAFGINGSLYAMLLYFVLYLQNGLHESALGAGLRLVVITAGSMLTAIPAGRLSERLPVRWLIAPGLILIGVGLLLMRGIGADSSWTHLIIGFAVAGAGSGLVNPPLASTAVGVVAPQDAGMASGINTTFRQIGIATSVAALGSIFASRIRGATTATLTAHYADSLNVLLLITAVVALVAGVLALGLIRRRDFQAHAAVDGGADAGKREAAGAEPVAVA
jgi:EmrB/QacA subfamily drug resistance transporter